VVEFNSQYQSLPTTRQEAESTGSKWYYTGIPCGNGHIRPRYTSCGSCVGCQEEHGKAQRQRQLGNYRAIGGKKVSEVRANITEKQRRNRIEAELELARIEKRYRGYDE